MAYWWLDSWVDGGHSCRTAVNVVCPSTWHIFARIIACSLPPRQIATLPPQYGLYSSFVGVLIYCVRFLLFSPTICLLLRIVLRHLERCLYRAGCRDVSHCGSSYSRRTEAPCEWEIHGAGNRHWAGIHLRIHRLGNWPPQTRLARWIYLRARCQWLHDWFRDQHCCWPSSWSDGDHRVQVSKELHFHFILFWQLSMKQVLVQLHTKLSSTLSRDYLARSLTLPGDWPVYSRCMPFATSVWSLNGGSHVAVCLPAPCSTALTTWRIFSAHVLLHQCVSERLRNNYLDAGRLAVLPAQKSAWELSHQDLIDSSFRLQGGEAANHHSQTYFSISTQASRRDDHSLPGAYRHCEMWEGRSVVSEKRSLISTAFGRLNSYKINPNQELIAIGVTNTVGSCFGAYPATGSFSRSALKSKSGVRTPLAGVYTAVVVIVALYGLTPAFFWIPTAALSAIIIHAVADLVASPAQVGLDYYLRLSTLIHSCQFRSTPTGAYRP